MGTTKTTKIAADQRVTADRRKRAATQLKAAPLPTDSLPVSPASLQRLVRELQVHQIELELQNEELRSGRAAVQAGHDRYADFYDFSPVGFVSTDREGVVRQINLAGAQLLGKTRSRLTGARFDTFVAQFDRPVFGSILEKVFATGHRQSGELTLTWAGAAEEVLHTVQLDAMLSADAQECRVVLTDITGHKVVDDKLRQLSRSVEQAPMSIVITDLDGCIQYANPKFTENTGYTLEEVLGQNPRILQSGLTAPEVYVDMWQTLSNGGVWRGELHNRKKNGDFFVELAVIAPVLDPQGQATHYVALKQDITQRIQADLTLQASLKEKVALLNEVHHRVKNNLQVITSLLRLEAGRSAHAETKVVLKDMQGRIQSMALLHETLYRSGTFASIDLGAYLKQLATQAFRAQSSQTGAVRLKLEVVAVQVVMDQATPCGLLINELISNSLKHGFPDGHSGDVVVQSQPSDTPGMWRVCVGDTGVGLPPDFEVRRTQSLGLQLVSDLARQLGGTLEIGPGPGARFCVTFALEKAALPAPNTGVSLV